MFTIHKINKQQNGCVYPSAYFISKTVQQILMKFGIAVCINTCQTDVILVCISPVKLSTWHEAELEFISVLHSGPSYKMLLIK
jgi:hypothetical protein